jgi:pilus assembly protein CpaE
MVNVLIAAISPVMEMVERAVKNIPSVTVTGSTDSIREAVDYCEVEPVEAVIVDETLLIGRWGINDRLSRVSCPLILVIDQPSAESTRRALAIRATDVVNADALGASLPALMRRFDRTGTDQQLKHRLIAVYSAKGGVGKSTLAVNLAWSLAHLSQHKTALVDLDLQFGDIGPMVHDRPEVTIQDLVDGSPTQVSADKLVRSLIAVETLPLDLLLAPLHPQYADAVQPHHIKDILSHLHKSHIYTICDLSSGLSEQNLTVMDMADVIIMVATPELITLRTVARSYKFLVALYPGEDKIRLVLNRAGSGMATNQIEDIVGLPISYFLPSGGVAPVRAANSGRPLTVVDPGNNLSHAIENIAKDFLEEYEGNSRRTARNDSP